MLRASKKYIKVTSNMSVGANDMQVMTTRIISEEQCEQTQTGVG